MNLQKFCENDVTLIGRVSHLNDLGELHARRLDEFSSMLPVSLASLIIKRGIACIDTEYGADALGIMQYVEANGTVGQGKITISEPERAETRKNGIDKIFNAYEQYAKYMGHNLSIIRGDFDAVFGWEKYGAILWLNMYPEFCDVKNLVRRLERCKNNLVPGGIALITQVEDSIYEEERYDKVMRRGLDSQLNIELVHSLGMLGSIGILLQN